MKLRTDSHAYAQLIEQCPIGLLKPNPRNARVHSRKQRRKIAASIKKFGFLNPILVDENNFVLAGHGRLEAAQMMGLADVPVIRFSHLTDTQKRAYLIADNKIADQSDFDRKILAPELAQLNDLLPAEGFDVSLTGFDAAEIDLLLIDLEAPLSEPADEHHAVPVTPVSRRGDIWAMGKHRHLCGDSRDAGDIKRLMAGARASAVFTDPPYNLRAREIGGRGKTQHQDFAFGAGEMSTRQFRQFLSVTLRNAIGVSAPGTVHYIFIDWKHIDDLIEVGRSLYGAMLNLVVWNKTNAGQGSFYRSQHELITVFRVGDEQHRNNIELGRHGRNRSNVWTYPGVNTFGRGRTEALASHPTVKPVALVADALLDCTARGEAVLDPFMGSGTTLLAAEKVGRVSFGIEYEPAYVDVAVTRWQAFTKLEATLLDDGRTFEEVAAARSEEDARA